MLLYDKNTKYFRMEHYEKMQTYFITCICILFFKAMAEVYTHWSVKYSILWCSDIVHTTNRLLFSVLAFGALTSFFKHW
jgi:hypothetical protein